MAKDPDKRVRWVSELLSCKGLLFPLCTWALLETESKMDKVPRLDQNFALSHRFSLQGDEILTWWTTSVWRWHWPVWHNPPLPPETNPPAFIHVHYSLSLSPNEVTDAWQILVCSNWGTPACSSALFARERDSGCGKLQTHCAPNHSHVIQVMCT